MNSSEQTELCIWVDIVERVGLYAVENKQLWFYSLPYSNLIIHVQQSNEEIYNLNQLAVGGLQFINLISHTQIKFTVDDQKEVTEINAFKNNQKVDIVIKRSCDINDLFKQYVCFFTNYIIQDYQSDLFYISIPNAEHDDLIFQSELGQITQCVEEFELRDSKKQNKKKPLNIIDNAFSKFQAQMKAYRTNYKDQIDSMGKINLIKHPLLIRVSIFVPLRANQLGLRVQENVKSSVFECVSYHKYDTDSATCLQKHMSLIKQKGQIILYNDQNPIPLIESPEMEQNNLLRQKLFNRLGDQSYRFEKLEIKDNLKLMNVHLYLTPPKPLDLSKRYIVRGDYVFHHYMQNGFDDKGWGCAYRSFMTILSWLILNQNGKPQPIPNHQEIQKLLVKMNDKPQNFIGSSDWIGAFEVSMLINKLTGVDCKILHISNGADILDKINEFKQHFQTFRSPIMFGGGVYAYTLLGIECSPEGQCRFLILDPHYIASDNIKTVIDKGGVQWRGVEMFLPGTFYNFCMPQNQ